MIDTGALTLRYEVGSGRFTDENLVVRLKAGAQDVEGRPWASRVIPSCDLGALCEAERLSFEGISEARDHSGFTGSGFAAGWEGTGSSLTWQVAPEAGGAYVLDLRYANGLGDPRTLTLTVDGGAARQVTLPPTGNWDSWGHVALRPGPDGRVARGRPDAHQVRHRPAQHRQPGAAASPATHTRGAEVLRLGLALRGRGPRPHRPDAPGDRPPRLHRRGFAAGFEGVGDSIGFDVTRPPRATTS